MIHCLNHFPSFSDLQGGARGGSAPVESNIKTTNLFVFNPLPFKLKRVPVSSRD